MTTQEFIDQLLKRLRIDNVIVMGNTLESVITMKQLTKVIDQIQHEQ